MTSSFSLRVATAQFATPVNICATQTIVNEFGHPLTGSSTLGAERSCLVHVYWASNSVIYPPDFSGQPDSRNALVQRGVSHIGAFVVPDRPNSGLFSIMLADPRPPQNSRLFVRVFNAPTLAEASFYGDSQLLTVRDNEVLIVQIGATTNAVDPRDDDGDGLNNSWEKSLGSDPNHPDSDGDDMADYEEFLAGTSPADPQSYLAIDRIFRDSNGDLAIEWNAVSGRVYQVQYWESDPTNLDGVTNLAEDVRAVTDRVRVEGLPPADRGFFRLRVIRE